MRYLFDTKRIGNDEQLYGKLVDEFCDTFGYQNRNPFFRVINRPEQSGSMIGGLVRRIAETNLKGLKLIGGYGNEQSISIYRSEEAEVKAVHNVQNHEFIVDLEILGDEIKICKEIDSLSTRYEAVKTNSQ